MAEDKVAICNSALTLVATRKIVTIDDQSKEARECKANYDLCRRAVLRMHRWNFATTRVLLQGKTVSNIVGAAGLIKVTAVGHGFTTGNLVSIQDVIGTQEANVTAAKITVVDVDNFTIDGSTFANAYVSGGIAGLAPSFEYAYKHLLPEDYIKEHTVQDTAGTVLVENDFSMEGGYMLTDFPIVRFRYIYDLEDTTKFDPLFDEALAAFLAHKIVYMITGSDTQKDTLLKDLTKILKLARFADSVEEPSRTFDDDVWIRSRVGPAQGFVRDPGT